MEHKQRKTLHFTKIYQQRSSRNFQRYNNNCHRFRTHIVQWFIQHIHHSIFISMGYKLPLAPSTPAHTTSRGVCPLRPNKYTVCPLSCPHLCVYLSKLKQQPIHPQVYRGGARGIQPGWPKFIKFFWTPPMLKDVFLQPERVPYLCQPLLQHRRVNRLPMPKDSFFGPETGIWQCRYNI